MGCLGWKWRLGRKDVNPFTAVLVLLSLWKWPVKGPDLKSLSPFFPLHEDVKGFLSKCTLFKVDLVYDYQIFTFQPGNFTDRGSEVLLVGAATSVIFVATKVFSRQTCVCCDESFVTTNMFVVTKQLFCHDKSMFVATKLCQDKYLSGQIWQNVCCDKHNFVTTKLLLWQKMCFVVTNVCLLQQNMFVVTKHLLWQKWYLWQLPPLMVKGSCVVMVHRGAECTCYTSGSVTFWTDLPLLFETKAGNCSPVSVNRTQGLAMICPFSLVLWCFMVVV